MPWLKKHQVLRKQLKEQGLYVRGKTFVQQVTTFYEGRIATALSTPDTGEKYAALLNIHEEMRGYISENTKLLERKAEIKVAQSRAPLVIGVITLLAMTVTAVALFMITGGLSIPLSDFNFGMAGLGELVAVSGVITLATDKKQPDHFKKLAFAENAAFNDLSGKVEKEMLSLKEQAPAQIFLPPVKASPLTRLEILKLRFLNASKNGSGKLDTAGTAPVEKTLAVKI